MTRQERITALIALGKAILSWPSSLEEAIQRTSIANPWFTPENCRLALEAIAQDFLAEEKLNPWVNANVADEVTQPRIVAIVMAGNIPLPGFQDFLCVFAAGHRAQIKLSEKDAYLLPALTHMLREIAPESASYVQFTEKLNDFEAVIATGSGNTSRYFDYYFSRYPNIIRHNRNSVAVLDGTESPEEMRALGHDIFRFFGLGCRNVSMLCLPKGYDLQPLIFMLNHHSDLMYHDKYRNNYDYNLALLLLNRTPHVGTDAALLVEHEALASRIACLHYHWYESDAELAGFLQERSAQLQCIVGHPKPGLNCIPFGEAQRPGLTDYPDNVDIMAFMRSL